MIVNYRVNYCQFEGVFCLGWENALGALATPNKMNFNDNLDNFRGNQHPAALKG